MQEMLEAIDKSIAKWWDIMNGIDTDRGVDNCALCQRSKSLSDGCTVCQLCPALLYVAMRDGIDISCVFNACGCAKTPWLAYSLRQWGCGAELRMSRVLANAELTFLYEVRRACIVTGGTFNVPTE